MNPLHWQEVPQKNDHHDIAPKVASAQPSKGAFGFIAGIMNGAAFSFLLMGLIAGYILGTILR